MKYELKIKGHLLQCGHCGDDPQFFPKTKKKLFCDVCDQEYDLEDWSDPIDLELNNFKHQYAQALDKYEAGLQLAALERMFK
jgi:hypothetical protein|tara:strand:- start:44 stop:289 length:246 start_codon:yes stop_codon:yes gene_type:complete